MSLANLNPGWLNFGAIVVSGLISGSVAQALNSRDAEENRNFRAQQREWNASIEARISSDKLETRETLVGLKKDMDSALRGVASIQQALMVRPTPSSLASQHTP